MSPAILCLRAEGFRLEGLSSFAPDGCYWVRETVGWVLQGATEGFKWRCDLSRLEGTGAGARMPVRDCLSGPEEHGGIWDSRDGEDRSCGSSSSSLVSSE